MTEPFEDIVRDALRGTSGAAGEMPTYHGAWQRGRRRRWIKRSALVATGAFVLLAALTVNLGRHSRQRADRNQRRCNRRRSRSSRNPNLRADPAGDNRPGRDPIVVRR